MVKSKDRIQDKMRSSSSVPSGISAEVERCLNPWNGGCRSANIALYIVYRGERIPLCWKCWREISRKNLVWEAY
ncbi:MAG: hypothetical protein QXX94_02850 [Candidatus Bathyarchaeia archaeon]